MKHLTSDTLEVQRLPAILLPAHRRDEELCRREAKAALPRWNVEREIELGMIVPTFVFKERHIKPSL